MSETTITLQISDLVAKRLAALISPGEGYRDIAGVVLEIIDHVQQAVYRPGSWERDWLRQALGDYWLANLEADPDEPAFDRVRHP